MKPGFALANWLICCSITVLLSMLTYQLMTHWYYQIHTLHVQCNVRLPLYLALDMFKKDIAQATEIELQSNACSMYAPYYRIYWYVRDGRLLRRSSRYDVDHHRWKKPATSLLAQDITQINFTPLYVGKTLLEKHLMGVQISITQGSTTIQQMGYMRNGTYKPRA